MTPALQVRTVSKLYPTPRGPVRALVDLSLDVQPGEMVAVQGPSGCGKTTLLLAAGGLLHPNSGQILVEGADLYALSGEARTRFRGAHIGFVFQQLHLVPYLSVLENVLTPALALPLPDARPRALDLIEHVGLSDRLHHVPAQLSTGERQRTALARALLARPKLVLADEPTGNLDEANGELVLNYLAEHARAGGAVLLATHERWAAERAQRVIRLHKPAASGTSLGEGT
jgi:ABC-type lipoprotein export system ATPase subunit